MSRTIPRARSATGRASSALEARSRSGVRRAGRRRGAGRMTERHPAINGEDGGDDREPVAREIERRDRGDPGLFFVVDVEIGGRSEDGAAFGGVLAAQPRLLGGDLGDGRRPRIVHPKIRAHGANRQQDQPCQRRQQQTERQGVRRGHRLTRSEAAPTASFR